MATATFNLSNSGRLEHQISAPTTTSPDSKPTVLFIHYWGGSIRTWRKVIFGLKESYPTVAVNLPGWAGSTLPDNNIQLTIEFQANAVLEFLLSLPPELKRNGIVLVGHSMGAKISLALAAKLLAQHQNQLTLKGMVFVAPAPPTALVLPAEIKDQQLHAYDSAESVEFTLTNVLSSRERLTEEDILIGVEDGLAGSQAAKEAWAMYGMGYVVTVPEGNGLEVVVLAGEKDIVERKDNVLSTVVNKLKETGFRVIFEVLHSARHLIPLEDPGDVVNAISQHF